MLSFRFSIRTLLTIMVAVSAIAAGLRYRYLKSTVLVVESRKNDQQLVLDNQVIGSGRAVFTRERLQSLGLHGTFEKFAPQHDAVYLVGLTRLDGRVGRLQLRSTNSRYERFCDPETQDCQTLAIPFPALHSRECLVDAYDRDDFPSWIHNAVTVRRCSKTGNTATLDLVATIPQELRIAAGGQGMIDVSITAVRVWDGTSLSKRFVLNNESSQDLRMEVAINQPTDDLVLFARYAASGSPRILRVSNKFLQGIPVRDEKHLSSLKKE